MGRRLLSIPALVAFAIGILPASSTRADAAATDKVDSHRKVQLFNIPSQALIPALQSYSAVTGYQVICDSRLASGRRSRPVVGLFTPETALRMLLDGTALTIRYTGPRDVTLALAGSNGMFADPTLGTVSGNIAVMVLDTLHVDVPVGAEDHADYSAYGMLVGSAVRSALAKDPATSHRIFDLQADILIGPSGSVSKVKLLSSTGISHLDATIMRVLTSAVVGKRPPDGLPQPVRIAVVSI